MDGRSTSATMFGTWPWKDGIRNSWRYSLPLLLQLIKPAFLFLEALLVESPEINCSSGFLITEVVRASLDAICPSRASFYKLLNIVKEPLNLVVNADERMTRCVEIIVVFLSSSFFLGGGRGAAKTSRHLFLCYWNWNSRPSGPTWEQLTGLV